MRSVFIYFILFISTTLLFSCKKYPEGGYHFNAIKHLKGGWQLKSYIVNGIDSTDLTLGANNIENYKTDFAEFYMSHGGKRADIGLRNHYRNYSISINNKKRDIVGVYEGNDSEFDSSGCHILNSQYCQKNIFCPDNAKHFYWKIDKLTKNDLILISETGDYKLVLFK